MPLLDTLAGVDIANLTTLETVLLWAIGIGVPAICGFFVWLLKYSDKSHRDSKAELKGRIKTLETQRDNMLETALEQNKQMVTVMTQVQSSIVTVNSNLDRLFSKL